MITVLAGVNGAGKSTIMGAYVRNRGGEYFNPDEVARSLIKNNSSLTQNEANSQAWKMGYQQLLNAIEADHDYTFETTLGGNSICKSLHEAIDKGREVQIIYCMLNSPELHIQRVIERVSKGGHDIPHAKIHERWKNSIHNVMGLIPRVTQISVYDNSSPLVNNKPEPIKIFSLDGDQLTLHFEQKELDDIPEWVKPLIGIANRRVQQAK